jgi:hypothetical protein
VVQIRCTSRALLQTLATYSKLDRGTASVYVQRSGLNLSAYAGQTVWVQFRTATNAALVTTFLVDDVLAR